MYLISVYFDEKSENQIQSYVDDIAHKCGNTFMMDNNVPPHMTISAFETLHEDAVIKALHDVFANCQRGKLEWVTVGTFPTVIFVQPVLNEYLHSLSCTVYERIASIADTKISQCYRPFSWLPHITIAKQLSETEMRMAFDVLQKRFSMFEGEIIRIELAKKKPYQVLASWKLLYTVNCDYTKL